MAASVGDVLLAAPLHLPTLGRPLVLLAILTMVIIVVIGHNRWMRQPRARLARTRVRDAEALRKAELATPRRRFGGMRRARFRRTATGNQPIGYLIAVCVAFIWFTFIFGMPGNFLATAAFFVVVWGCMSASRQRDKRRIARRLDERETP